MITAVVLSAHEYTRKWPGLEVLVHRSIIKDAADLLRARFDALEHVRTDRAFFLDDDDDLPPDYLRVLDRCMTHDAALVYTDELVNGEVRRSHEYDRLEHYRNPLLVHHLALYRTDDALRAVRRLPRGHYCPEFLLAWEVARDGAAYVPEVGYHWNKSPTGMHRWPCTTLSQMRAVLWAKGN